MLIRNFTLILCSVLGLAGTATTQNYYFPTADAIWEENGTSLLGNFIKYHFLCGDTIIQDQTYQKIYYADFRYSGDSLLPLNETLYAGALRIDGSRVYLVDNFGEPEEILLYDFALEEETEINLPSPTVGADNLYQVSSVDSVLIEGTLRRRLTLESLSDQTTDVWIEGIGSITYGLLDRALGLVFDYGSSLRCFRDDNQDFTYTVSGKEPCIFEISEPCQQIPSASRDLLITRFYFFPNPTSGSLTIELPVEATATYRVVITDLLGRQVFMQPFGTGTFNLAALPAGPYSLNIWDGGRPASVARRLLLLK